MRFDTVSLTGPRLDFAVAMMLKAELKPNSIDAQHAYVNGKYVGGFVTRKTDSGSTIVAMPHNVFSPSRQAAVGQPIVESRVEELRRTDDGWCAIARSPAGNCIASGETMLIAGLRAAVLADMGAIIDIPDWLESK